MSPAGAARIACRLAALAGWLAAALVLHGVTKTATGRSRWPIRFLRGVGRIVGLRIAVRGSPRPRDVLMLANHQSWLDIVALAATARSAFVAKGELARSPLVGWLARLNATLFVDRGDRLGVARQVARLRDALLADHPVTVFPEGTTGDGTALLPFKASLLGVVDPPPPGLVVQPVRLDYGAARADVAWAGGEPGVRNALRVLARGGRIPLTVTFLDPFDPAGAGRKAVAARAQEAIAAA